MLAAAACSSDGAGAQGDAGTNDGGASDSGVSEPLALVDPFIGTGGFGFAHGSAFPGAMAPQGLAKVGPDTFGEFADINFLHYSGYYSEDDTIRGFSHLHLQGTGAMGYGILGVMPVDSFDASRTDMDGYASTFAKESEVASPGYYAVTLDSGEIRVELTATERGAHECFWFEDGATEGHLVVDLAHHLADMRVEDAEIVLTKGDHAMAGRIRAAGGMTGDYELFFAARTRQPWTRAQVWSDGAAPADFDTASGVDVGAALTFPLSPGGDPVELQVGLSFVSIEAAQANLDAEFPAFAFEATRARTEAAWDALLRTIIVEGGSETERRIFYSSLYRAFHMPTIMSDAGGSYRGFDGEVHEADGFRYVSDMSLWDTYRTLHPLYHLIAPDRGLDAVRSLHAMAEASGYFPKWPVASHDSGTMIGASAEDVVADAYAKGITDFDAAGAYAILRAAALDTEEPIGGRGGRDAVDYVRLGWVPATRGGSVSITTEYSHGDFALARLAEALGETDDEVTLDARRLGYRELFDPKSGFLRGRNEGDGDTWAIPDDTFDPLAFSDDYVEANAWQSVWMAQHDVSGLAELFGGKDALVAKLEEMFEATKADWEARSSEDMWVNAQGRPYYWHGNEPDLHAPLLFAQAGRPDLAARWTRWIMANLYTDGTAGLAGNDDGGTLSAWYVFAAIGIYPIPGSDRYIVGAPLFRRARIAVDGGSFVIDAPAASAENIYVRSVTLDGESLDGGELRHADIAAGSTLAFEMAAEP